jgi:hypothetical protein
MQKNVSNQMFTVSNGGFLLAIASGPALRLAQALIQQILAIISAVVKRPKREANH